MENIKITDIDTTRDGFSCKKIKKLSDKKLLQIEESVNEQLNISVLWANIEYMGYLSVVFSKTHFLTEKEIETIVNILNTL